MKLTLHITLFVPLFALTCQSPSQAAKRGAHAEYAKPPIAVVFKSEGGKLNYAGVAPMPFLTVHESPMPPMTAANYRYDYDIWIVD